MPGTARGYRLRVGRHSEIGRIYSITFVCWQRRRFFATWEQGRCVVRALRSVADQADTLCFVVMPDHVHWLLQLGVDVNLSAVVQKVKALTARDWHRRNNSAQRLWQRGFHDRALRKEDDVRAVARYIVANPLRAGLTGSLRDYPLWDAIWL